MITVKSDGKELTMSALYAFVTLNIVLFGNFCSKIILILVAVLPFVSCVIPKAIPPGPDTISF